MLPYIIFPNIKTHRGYVLFLVADFIDSESAHSDGVAGLDELLTLSCDIAIVTGKK